MRLQSLRLHQFRAHAETTVTFAPKVNLVYGANGAGKTNLLEAIHYLGLTKSWLASQDGVVIHRGAPFFEVSGRLEGGHREIDVRLVYVPDEGKRVFVNRSPLDRLTDIVGQVPLVLMAPQDHALTSGGPEERRRFLDNTLSQAKPVYLDDLLKYRRALKQRNALLQTGRRSGRLDAGALEAWNEELVTLGARLIARRQRFVADFAGFLAEAYHRMEAASEEPTLEYQTVVPLAKDMDEESISAAFRSRLSAVARRERDLGRTLLGPHRDELVFRLDGYEVRPYASQGQHRTFGMALQLAKFFYLQDRLDETPLLLLDDVFGDLDAHRARVFLELLQSDAVGQSIITGARPEAFEGLVPFEAPEHRAIRVVNGAVPPADAPDVAPSEASSEAAVG